MMIKFTTHRKAALMFAIAVAWILLGSQASNAAVRPLEINELAKIIGMCKDCVSKGPGCSNLQVGCVLPGQKCRLRCEHIYQDWGCGKGKYGCVTDPARSCGTQWEGNCDENLNCVLDVEQSCGYATNCHRVY